VRRLRLAARYALGVPALRASDVLLCSFPRSGSTLVRFALEHYARLLAGAPGADAGGPLGFADLNAGQLELGVSDLRAPWRSVVPRVVKTHRPYSAVLARPHAVLVVRRPLDALASYHTYWTARAGAPDVPASDFLRDRRRGLPRWIRHTVSWERRAELVARYEALRDDPAAAVADVLRLGGHEPDPGALAEAVARAAAPRVRAAEADGGAVGSDAFTEGFVFARNLRPGAGAARFSPSDRAWAAGRLAAAGLDPTLADPP
jgi:hypothetical protein